MNRRSAAVIAAMVVGALMAGVAGATHRALDLKASAKPGAVVIIDRAAPTPAAVAPIQPSENDD
jgi:hypothetical protein